MDEEEQNGLFEYSAEEGLGEARKPHVRSFQVFRKPRFSDDEPELMEDSWRDWIPKDDLVWVLKPVVRELDVSGLADLYADRGGVAYDPVRLLVLVLYGSWEGMHSSRELEKRCQTDARYRYLMDGQVPDHCTIHRFLHRVGDSLPDLLAQTVEYLGLEGRCPRKRGAIDGVRVAGNVSQWRDSGSDPEARTLARTQGDYVTGYNLQVAVDMEGGAVLGCAATNESHDGSALEEALDACQEQGGLPQQLALDAGYDGAANAEALAERGVESFVSPKGKDAEFWRESEDGKLVCPAGHALRRQGSFPGEHGRRRVRYRIKECSDCPLKATCCKGRYKTLTVPEGVDPVHWVRNAHRARSPEGESMRVRRSCTVELLFAQLFWNQRFRRLLMRGLSGARVHLLVLCLAHNLRLLAGLGSDAWLWLLALVWEPTAGLASPQTSRNRPKFGKTTGATV